MSCQKNVLEVLDVSKNINLTRLLCNENKLESLDVSNNVALLNLGCYKNPLKKLDVSKNTELTQLGCTDIELTEIDVSNNLNDPTLNIIKVSLSGRFYLLNVDKVNIFVGPTIGYASGRDKANDSNVGAFLPNLDTLTRYSGLNYGINAGANYYFTDSFGFIFQLSYESSNLKSTLSQTGNQDVLGTTKLNGLNISGGIAVKF